MPGRGRITRRRSGRASLRRTQLLAKQFSEATFSPSHPLHREDLSHNLQRAQCISTRAACQNSQPRLLKFSHRSTCPGPISLVAVKALGQPPVSSRPRPRSRPCLLATPRRRSNTAAAAKNPSAPAWIRDPASRTSHLAPRTPSPAIRRPSARPVLNECIHLERAKPSRCRFPDRCRHQRLVWIIRHRGCWYSAAHCP